MDQVLHVWTPYDREVAVLGHLAETTDLQRHHLGEDSSGYPVYLYTLGDLSTPTFFSVCSMHGNEPAPREAALTVIPELAHAGAPHGYSLAWMPSPAPSALEARLRRPPAHDIDPNSDMHRLRTVEPLLIHRALNITAPCALADLHEYGGNRGEVTYSARTAVHAHPEIDRWGRTMERVIEAAVTSAGWSWGPYGIGGDDGFGSSRLTLKSVCPDRHMASLLTETRMNGPRADRIAQNVLILRRYAEWFAAHHRAVQESSDRSAYSSTHGGNFTWINADAYRNASLDSAFLHGWQLDPGQQVPEKYVEAFQIVVYEYGFVPVHQRHRNALAFHFDPRSVWKGTAAAQRVYVPSTARLGGVKVMHAGRLAPVVSMVTMHQGRRRPVSLGPSMAGLVAGSQLPDRDWNWAGFGDLYDGHTFGDFGGGRDGDTWGDFGRNPLRKD